MKIKFCYQTLRIGEGSRGPKLTAEAADRRHEDGAVGPKHFSFSALVDRHVLSVAVGIRLVGGLRVGMSRLPNSHLGGPAVIFKHRLPTTSTAS